MHTMTSFLAQAIPSLRESDRAGMTPEQTTAAEAERAAWIANAQAQEAAKWADERRRYYLSTPRYDTPTGPGRPYRLAGRCSNGYDRDAGRLVHVRPLDGGHVSWRAVCGAEPGGRSAGWSNHMTGAATCPRCLKRSTLAAPADVY